jgi:hypothetical protein
MERDTQTWFSWLVLGWMDHSSKMDPYGPMGQPFHSNETVIPEFYVQRTEGGREALSEELAKRIFMENSDVGSQYTYNLYVVAGSYRSYALTH